MGDSEHVSITQGKYKGWDSWHLRRGLLELVLVPQVGGRIMGMEWLGRNLSFTDPNLEGQVVDLRGVQDVRAKKQEMGFLLWGGGKTWLAPQTRWTDGVPFLDLDSGPFDIHVDHDESDVLRVRMTSQVCRETGVQITRTVTMQGGTQEWIVTHLMLNASSKEIKWGVWDVTMVLKSGRVYLPTRESSLYPKGVRTFAEEGESVQIRNEVVGELEGIAVITCGQPRAYKFGVDAEEGWMLGVLEVPGLGLVGYRKEVPAFKGQPYGHGCIAEVYNSDRYPYFEMEIHGPISRLKPGESFELEERQALFDVPQWPRSEEEVRRYLRLHQEHSN